MDQKKNPGGEFEIIYDAFGSSLQNMVEQQPGAPQPVTVTML